MRRVLLAGVTAIGLTIGPTQARADISFGELSDALADFGEDMMAFLIEILLAPLENVPEMAMPFELPAAIVGEHVYGYPVTPAAAQEYAVQRVADRILRVTTFDELVTTAADAALQNVETLALLSAANSAAPFSIASELQIGNAAALVDSSADAIFTQYLSAQMAMEADQAFHEEESRTIAITAYDARMGPIEGGGVAATTFNIPW